MAKTARNNQIRRDRRKALQVLRMIYPGWMDGEELFRILLDTNPEYGRPLLVKDANYLHEKSYLEYRGNAGIDVHSISVKDCQFKLTAAGTDVADRLVDDPTLEI
jgi:hypothetical protein